MKRRNTRTKEAVLHLLSGTRKAMSQSAIERRLQVAINRATIYRVLNRFCEDGLIHKIVAEDGKQYFAMSHSGQQTAGIPDHFHFRCLSCETIECLQLPVSYSLPGYHVEQANCVLTGTCNECSQAT